MTNTQEVMSNQGPRQEPQEPRQSLHPGNCHNCNEWQKWWNLVKDLWEDGEVLHLLIEKDTLRHGAGGTE